MRFRKNIVRHLLWMTAAVILLVACRQTKEITEGAGNKAFSAEISDQEYNAVREGAILDADGSKIHQLYFYTKQPLDLFLSKLEERLGASASEESKVYWKNLNVQGWSSSPVTFSIDIRRIQGRNESWYAVYINVATETGSNLLVPSTESKEAIESYIQSVIDTTLAE